MKDTDILKEVQRLAFAKKFDEAIALTNTMQDKAAGIKAHLLVIELEQATRLGI